MPVDLHIPSGTSIEQIFHSIAHEHKCELVQFHGAIERRCPRENRPGAHPAEHGQRAADGNVDGNESRLAGHVETKQKRTTANEMCLATDELFYFLSCVLHSL